MSLFDTNWSLQVKKIVPPILRDADFIEQNNDFMPIDPSNLYIERILASYPGHWKQFPLVGVGIWNYLQGTQSRQVIQRAIRVQLESDVYKKPSINVDNFPTIIINSVSLTVG